MAKEDLRRFYNQVKDHPKTCANRINFSVKKVKLLAHLCLNR